MDDTLPPKRIPSPLRKPSPFPPTTDFPSDLYAPSPPLSISSPPAAQDIWASPPPTGAQRYDSYPPSSAGYDQLVYTPSYVGSYPGSDAEYSSFGGRRQGGFDMDPVSDDELLYGPPRAVDEDASSQHPGDEYDPREYEGRQGLSAQGGDFGAGGDGVFALQRESMLQFPYDFIHQQQPQNAPSPGSSAAAGGRSRASSVASFHSAHSLSHTSSPRLDASLPPPSNPITDFSGLSFHPSPTPPPRSPQPQFHMAEPSPPPSHLAHPSPPNTANKPQSPPQLLIPDSGTGGGLSVPQTQEQKAGGAGLLGVGGPQINLTPATPISAITAKPGDNQSSFQDVLRNLTSGPAPPLQRFPAAPSNPQHPLWPPPAQQHQQPPPPPLVPTLPPFGAQFGNYTYFPAPQRVRSKSDTGFHQKPNFGPPGQAQGGFEGMRMGGWDQQQHQGPTSLDPSVLGMPSTSPASLPNFSQHQQQQEQQYYGSPSFPPQQQPQLRRVSSGSMATPLMSHTRQSRSVGGTPSFPTLDMPSFPPSINPSDGTLLPPLLMRDPSAGPDRRGRRSSHGSSASTAPYSRSPSPNAGAMAQRPLRDMVTTPATAAASQGRRTTKASFICPIPGCGSTFTRSFNLKGHLRSHNEERPFKCHWPGCEKGFARQHDCKRHEALHLNIRPFTCEGCGRNFARMDALNRHLRSEGGNECARTQPMVGEDGQPLRDQSGAGMGVDDEMRGGEEGDDEDDGGLGGDGDDADEVPMTAPRLDGEEGGRGLVM